MYFKWLMALFILFANQISSSNLLFAKDKIALLFLTRSDLHHPNLWKRLLSESKEKYNLYIHSANTLKDPFFQKHRIQKIVSTSWATHAKAWHVLVQEAFKNSENRYFAFLSESCIPLYSLDYIYSVITTDPRTHIAFARPWWPNFIPVEAIPPTYVHANTEWMVLNRKHAGLIASDRAIIRLLQRHEQDQEIYFSTLFAINDALEEDICNHSYTYVNWRYAINDGANPHHFSQVNSFNDILIEEAYEIGALFARKFTIDYPEKHLLKMIRNQTAKICK